MKALLLNSGLGSRMGSLTEGKPKCMCPIGNGHTIISWQLELLRKNNVSDVIVTTGPFAELLQEHAIENAHDLKLTFVNNPSYNETNYIYSMHLAREFLDDDVLLLHGDLVLENSVMADLKSAAASVVAVDSELPLPPKDFKAIIKDKGIAAIGVDLFGNNCVACQPAYKLLRLDFDRWMTEISKFCDSGNVKVYAEEALNSISGQLHLNPLELGGRLCNEIDNPEDLKNISVKFAQIFGGIK